MNDIEISQAATEAPITEIAGKLDLSADQIEQYGAVKAKIKLPVTGDASTSKLILVTSINPTPAGEGKSTVTVGLGDALQRQGKKVAIALREPSLGPVMGIKGGATGGGYAQVIPMEDINLHFTGDMGALTEAHDTLSALIDNHIQQGNELNIDPRQVIWKRVIDINDRALRQTVIGLGGRTSGIPRQDGFDITVASELMAILCLSKDLADLKARINKIVIGYTYDKDPVTVADLKVGGAIALLLKDAIKPNLVQTIEHTPAIIHGGPFANIAHGCNSVIATKSALALANYVVTESGFGADLGGEKFMDIKTPVLGKTPDAVVIVATVRALKYNGGVDKNNLQEENLAALATGSENLKRHVTSMSRYGVPVIVAVNRFTSDTDAEIDQLLAYVKDELHVQAFDTTVWANGGGGALDLADAVVAAADEPSTFKPLYDSDDDLVTKMTKIVQNIYGGRDVELEPKAKRQLKTFQKQGWDKLPVCMAKTQYSLSDNAKALGAPTEFTIHVREFVPKLGAGFIVAMTGNVLTMPGLPKHPAALDMDIDADGKITGLF
ncbi:formate--tetrahydrofolate ligase [Secundilactobacillus paracollinoides]|uniref:Formate--tetrahydrofolate ligase n=1 Tax=Secundilactobacillus paracollinoides TaxID=240427 RepID=A0A1B2J162_9LACO|nr:formate--tetrahydrofolate ligase [Secundilactobacillus paracollinoides]ANZ62082.1 formate--tetrahydrofolate ligase [Secundilactobacillus paracollinoides]ANZ63766.1 formate--tetrahydrofolate ligase [Secundilactobacillus paracollinoides]ANZ68027.1 formate--tetrahydrofolate ligase [Secundilactobacillus paracollinoides]KRL76509.1 formate--tetrahydrofolate ligase [Secundilactobacillus paracollinoides DSM 15502 = JCM 11969]